MFRPTPCAMAPAPFVGAKTGSGSIIGTGPAAGFVIRGIRHTSAGNEPVTGLRLSPKSFVSLDGKRFGKSGKFPTVFQARPSKHSLPNRLEAGNQTSSRPGESTLLELRPETTTRQKSTSKLEESPGRLKSHPVPGCELSKYIEATGILHLSSFLPCILCRGS